MPNTSFAFAALFAALLTIPSPTLAQRTESAQPAKPPRLTAESTNDKATAGQTRQTATPVVYVPPLRGAPSFRVVAATRGRSSRVFLATLAPDHAGWTTRAQPTLYWYVSEPVDGLVELTIVDDEAIDPLLEICLHGPLRAGVQAFDLEKQGITLTTGKGYLWSVSIIHDAEQRSKDTFAEGAITRVEPSASLEASLEAAERDERPGLLAGAGFWYDAVDEISRLAAEDSPDANRWRRERVELLEQVGIGALVDGEGIRLDR